MKLKLSMMIMLFLTSQVAANKTVQQWAFNRLDYARDEKIQHLKRYCDKIHKQAQSAAKDQVMLNFFDIKYNGYDLRKNGRISEEFEKKLIEFRNEIADYYIKNYICFYDILFISVSGEIFYTIRKESDYLKNIFSTDLAKTKLSRQLRKKPKKEIFVDFEYFEPSDEPAAFFVEPVNIEGEFRGWFVFQCAINKVNSLFTGYDELGTTGEVFLVNKDGFLLTESNFIGDSSVLKVHLDEQNIKPKFEKKRGNKIVTDYRGSKALSSFQNFNFLDTQWLVVAKIDQGQVITEHFQQHHKYYFDKMRYILPKGQVCSEVVSPEKEDKKIKMIDMDEFIKANHNELLKTMGVSTCTAVIATYPKKFGYMAHISPLDEMYGESGTDILGHIVQKIKNYDIYKYQRGQVQFNIIAGHLESFENIVEKLVGEGFLLSQINMLHFPDAKYANVLFDYSKNLTYVEWVTKEGDTVKQNICDDNNLGRMVKKLLAH